MQIPLARLALAVVLASSFLQVHAQPAKAPTPPGAPAQPTGPRYLLAVSEGTSGGTSPQEIIDKYKPLADLMGKVLGGQVLVDPSRSFQRLDEGLRAKRFDLAMARPSDYPARAVRDNGYRYVANASPDGQCVFLVPQKSAAKTLADLKGKRILLPEKISYMAQFCSAELRDAGLNLSQLEYVKEQEVVVYQLQNNRADLGGVASYSKALKGIGDAGLRELVRSRPQPYFPLIAGQRISPTQIAALRKELVKMKDTPAGKEILAKLGLAGFDDTGEKRLAELLAWLEKT
ncbi:hypothetical protein BWI17_22110 [Betaproteobacteria bacterium GR16-43]|nr:hypothetical protein BWI17_22110 [Betaproteobacteria bacterium GR16-43]